MGDPGRWRGLQPGRRGRHEAPPRTAAARAAVVVLAVVAVAAVAVATRSSSSSRGANPPTSRAAAAPKLIAAPGFSFGLGEARALPGTYLIKGQVGVPTAPFVRVQRDPTVAAPGTPPPTPPCPA